MAAAADNSFPLSQLSQRSKETARLNAEKREIDRIEQTNEFKAKVFKITTQHDSVRNRYGDILPRTAGALSWQAECDFSARTFPEFRVL